LFRLNENDATPLDYFVNPKRNVVLEYAQMERNDLDKKNLTDGTYRRVGQEPIHPIKQLYDDNDKVPPTIISKRAERAKARAIQRRTKIKNNINQPPT